MPRFEAPSEAPVDPQLHRLAGAPESELPRPRVSIIIKALNEEAHIEAAISSALTAVHDLGGEVVLADSCSTDRTVALATRYPIRIVQLARPDERCCGAGPQLGYQHSHGEFVYILDGDMKIAADFLPQALAFMQAHPDVAGVGGQVVELNTSSLEYRAREERSAVHMQCGEVDRLDMGGLYRRAAIDDAGYFSNRNLHSYEEFELAVRLRARGWKMWRIATDAVQHHGHNAPAFELLLRRWQTGYICGLGEVVRAAGASGHLWLVLTSVRELKLYAGVWMWWLVLLVVPAMPVAASLRLLWFSAIVAAPFWVMAWRKRSVARGSFAVVSWCFNAAGLVRGVLWGQPAHAGAHAAIDSVQIHPNTFNTLNTHR